MTTILVYDFHMKERPLALFQRRRLSPSGIDAWIPSCLWLFLSCIWRNVHENPMVKDLFDTIFIPVSSLSFFAWRQGFSCKWEVFFLNLVSLLEIFPSFGLILVFFLSWYFSLCEKNGNKSSLLRFQAQFIWRLQILFLILCMNILLLPPLGLHCPCLWCLFVSLTPNYDPVVIMRVTAFFFSSTSVQVWWVQSEAKYISRYSSEAKKILGLFSSSFFPLFLLFTPPSLNTVKNLPSFSVVRTRESHGLMITIGVPLDSSSSLLFCLSFVSLFLWSLPCLEVKSISRGRMLRWFKCLVDQERSVSFKRS